MKIDLPRRPRWRRVGIVVGVVLLASAAGLVVDRWDEWTAEEYYVSDISFKAYRRQGIPDDIVALLDPLLHQRFGDEQSLLSAIRGAIGDAAYVRHEAVLSKHIRVGPCSLNEGGQASFRIAPSREHAAYNSLKAETVVSPEHLPGIPTQLAFLPEGAGAVVLGKHGGLTHFDSSWKPVVALNLPGVYAGGGDQGALGLAVDPEFARNRFLYAAFVSADEKENVVQRITLEGSAETIQASRRDVIRFPKDKRRPFHGIGNIAFTSRGTLLIQVGDPMDHAQAWGDLEGKLLAIVPLRGAEGGYRIPDDPIMRRLLRWIRFGSQAIVAKGLRSPFSGAMWRDHLFIGDVGSDGPYSVEEVDVFAGRDENFAWHVCEDPDRHGTHAAPILAYFRGDTTAARDDPDAPRTDSRSIVVGTMYDDDTQDRYGGQLDRRLLYGDVFLGFVRGARIDDDLRVVDDVHLTHVPFVTDMAVSPDGYVHAVTAFGPSGLVRLRPR